MFEFEEQLGRDPQTFSLLPRETAVLPAEDLEKAPKVGLVQTQVTPLDIVRVQLAGGSPVGWVQPTILQYVRSGGLHPPYGSRVSP